MTDAITGAMKGNTPSTGDKLAALHGALQSQQFRRAAKLRGFLQYVGEHTIEGRTEEIHETAIGRAVYERPLDYIPAEDSIVRVEARNLRKKLEAYYESEGKADPVVISIPKGSYAPKFEFRGESLQALKNDRSALARPAVVLALALVASLAVNLWLISSFKRADSESRVETPEVTQPVWSAMFGPGQETYIVLADSLHAVVQDFGRRQFSLEDYRRPGFPTADDLDGIGPPFRDFALEMFRHQHTSVADVQVAGRLMQLAAVADATPTIRFARNMHMRDFKGSNVILLGSSMSNPWSELFEPCLNFKFEYEFQSRMAYVLNKIPRSGERVTYEDHSRGEGSGEIYAVISFVRNLTNDGNVLMIAGTGMEGTEAAGELLLNPETTSNMIRDLGLEEGGKLRPFEVLLHSSMIEGTSKGAKVLTHRIPVALCNDNLRFRDNE